MSCSRDSDARLTRETALPEVRVIPLRTRPPPNYLDREKEIVAVNCLLDTLENDPTDPRLETPSSISNITPWVAFQLGCLVEADPYVHQPKLRTQLALLAVAAARESRSSDQLFANLLSLANLCLRVGDRAVANQVFQMILNLPLPHGEDERAAAHISLAQDPDLSPTESVFHYEMGIMTHGKQISDQDRSNLARQITDIYRQRADLAGLVHVCVVLGLGDPNELLIPSIDELSLEDAINLATRLSFLGHQELSHQVRKEWIAKNGS